MLHFARNRSLYFACDSKARQNPLSQFKLRREIAKFDVFTGLSSLFLGNIDASVRFPLPQSAAADVSKKFVPDFCVFLDEKKAVNHLRRLKTCWIESENKTN